MNTNAGWFIKWILPVCFSFAFFISPAQNWEVNILKHANPDVPNSNFWQNITRTSKPISYSLPLIMFAASLPHDNKDLQKHALESFGTLAINAASIQIIKVAVNRDRPYQTYTDIHPDIYQNGKSFVSGHTALAFGSATTLSLQFKKWYVVAPAYAWAGAIGYSRLYLGQHYPTDLMGAAVVGAGSAYLSHKANKWLQNKKNKSPKENPAL